MDEETQEENQEETQEEVILDDSNDFSFEAEITEDIIEVVDITEDAEETDVEDGSDLDDSSAALGNIAVLTDVYSPSDVEIETSEPMTMDNQLSYEDDSSNNIGGHDDEPEDVEDNTPDLVILRNKIKTVTNTYTEPIPGVLTQEDIAKINELNASIYAVLNDGTRIQCELTDVFVPEGPPVIQYVNQGMVLASAIHQHFWHNEEGAHITDDTQEDWLEEYAKTNHGELSDPTIQKPWHNILINSYGYLLRKGLLWLSQQSVGATLFYDGLGNTSNNVVAGFMPDGIQIGKLTEKHLIIDTDGLHAYDENGDDAAITARLSGSYIENSSITNSKIADGTITGSKIIGSTLTDIPYAEIDALKARNISADAISAATAFIGSLIASSITANDISADHATIGSLSTNYAHITNGVIDNAKIGHADVNGLSANYAHISNGAIDNAKIGHADVNGLSANYAHISNGVIDNAKIGHADVNGLSANYAEINMANVNNAWIQNGTIKDAAISDGMINSVSANKLTAGTIDASNITVTNLNADNITAGTLNGQRIGDGSLSLDKLSDDVYTETEVNNIVQNLQTQIDGAIETWTGTTIPTLQNSPASNWTTNSVKDTHIGDVYFVVNQNSDQNGYNYRFTKINDTYSWQLIKDNDVTQALQRLTTAEGKIGTIEQFDSTISSWKTDTDAEISSIKSAATTLAGRVTTAEGDIATKVDTTTFNQLSQTVDTNSSSITQLTTETTAITEKITLDKPYKEVEWVEFTGKQFIRVSNWRPGLNGAFGFDADFITYNAFNNSAWPTLSTATREANEALIGAIFGVRASGANVASNWGPNYTYYSLHTYTSNGYVYNGGYRANARLYTDKRRQQCSLRNGTYTAPDGTVINIGIPAYKPANAPMHISSMSTAAGTSSAKLDGPCVTRIYSLKFYDDDDLAVDLVPAIRKSDNIPGLYDSLSDEFYPAQGLLYGDVVGELGEPQTLLGFLESTNVILDDGRTRNSRLITVYTDKLTKLRDGQQLNILLKHATVKETFAEAGITATYANPVSSEGVWLAIKTLDGDLIGCEYPIYYNSSTLLTTHYVAGTVISIRLCYNFVSGTSAVGRMWLCDANYNINTDTNTVTDKIANTVVAGKNGINNYSLVMKDDEGNWTSLTTTAGTALTKVAYNGPLQFQNVAYSTPNTRYEPGSDSADGVFNSYAVDVRYSMNVANNATTGLIARQPVYIVGEVHSDGYFYLDTPWWTQTVPTEEDGKTYIYLGIPYSYYQMWLAGDNTIYRFIDGEFVPVYIHTIERTVNRVNEVTDTVSEHSRKIGALETTVETKADGSSVTTISSQLNTLSDTVGGHTQRISEVNSTISGLDTRVQTAESTIQQHTSDIQLKANASDTYTKQATNALLEVKANKDTLTSEINASADTVKINASRVEINGPAIFSSISSSIDNAISTQLAPVSTVASDASALANSVNDGLTNLGNTIGTTDKLYQEVEWVESDGRQFVTTHWYATEQSGFDIDFQLIDSCAVGYQKVRGNINPEFVNVEGTSYTGTLFANINGSGATRGFGLSTNGASGRQGWIACDATNKLAVNANGSIGFYTDGRRQQASLRNRVYTAPNGTVKTLSESAEFTTANCVAVFCAMQVGIAYNSAIAMRLYSLKFYDGDTLAVDLVGAIRKSDGNVGLFDKVEQHFYPSQGLTHGDLTGNELGIVYSVSDQIKNVNPVVTDLRTADSRVLRVSCPTLEEVPDGQQITIQSKHKTATQTTTLHGFEASANNIVIDLSVKNDRHVTPSALYFYGTTQVTTQLDARMPTTLYLTYRENIFSGTTPISRVWYHSSFYDTNTNTYDRRLHNNAIKATVAITAGHLICGTSAGYQHIAANVSFDLSYPILYASAAIKINATAANTYEAIPSVTFTTTGVIQGAAANAMLYLKGTITGNMFTIASTNFLTTVVPTEEDGCFYIPLGIMVSATQGYFATSKDLYAFIDGRFRQVTPTEVVSTQLIYISQPSGTTSVDALTVWVTVHTDSQNTWTTKRPTYDTNYPVLFVATQTKRLDSTVTCTSPLKDDTTTVIDGGHITTGTIDANRISTTVINAINANVSDTINANKIDAQSLSIGQSQVSGLTTSLTNASKRTYVSIRATAVDYAANTATLEATLYIDGVATTTDVTYIWLKDGAVISGATSRTYSVPASNGLDHAYSCKCVATV